MYSRVNETAGGHFFESYRVVWAIINMLTMFPSIWVRAQEI